MKPQTRLVQVVPTYAPVLDGIGDYARRLVRALEEFHGLASSVVICDPAWQGPDSIDGFPVVRLERRSPEALAAALGSAGKILVHHVVYGYQKRGVPFWLEAGLARWRRRNPQGREVVFFHELWASGPIWKSEFWLGPLQRMLVARRCRLADAVLTSCRIMARRLEQIKGREISVSPVPPIFEGAANTRREITPDGKCRLLVFGQPAMRQRALAHHADLIRAMHVEGRIRRIIVAGRGAVRGSSEKRLLAALAPGSEIEFAGELAVEGLGSLFERSDFLLSSHPASLACKSTVVMSAMSVGCIPVLRDSKDAEPLSVGREFLAFEGGPGRAERFVSKLDHATLRGISDAAQAWCGLNATWEAAALRIALALTRGCGG